MIALGLTVQLIAGLLVVVGVLQGDDGVVWHWSAVAVVLAGLGLVVAGLRRARPARGGVRAPSVR